MIRPRRAATGHTHESRCGAGAGGAGCPRAPAAAAGARIGQDCLARLPTTHEHLGFRSSASARAWHHRPAVKHRFAESRPLRLAFRLPIITALTPSAASCPRWPPLPS